MVTIITKLLQCVIHNIYIHVLKIKLSDPDNLGLLIVYIIACIKQIKKSANSLMGQLKTIKTFSSLKNKHSELLTLYNYESPTVTNNYDRAECEVMLTARQVRGGTYNY